MAIAALQSSQVENPLRRVASALGVGFESVLDKGVETLLILAPAWVGFRVLASLTRRLEPAVTDTDVATLNQRQQRGRTLVPLLNSGGVVVIAIAAGTLHLVQEEVLNSLARRRAER